MATELQFNNAAITSGLGMVEDPELAFYHSDIGKYKNTVIQGIYDVASVTGNITVFEDGYFPHVHISFNDERHNTSSGHVITGKVHIIMEIFLRITDVSIHRVRTNANDGTHIEPLES